jgi:hypothetical protein
MSSTDPESDSMSDSTVYWVELEDARDRDGDGGLGWGPMTGEDEDDDDVDDDADTEADVPNDGESVSRTAWGANDRKSAQRENNTSVICMIMFSA